MARKSCIVKPTDTKSILNHRKIVLTSGVVYLVGTTESSCYDLTNRRGRKSNNKRLLFVCETENLYVFEHPSGLRECFSKYTPKGELKIKLA